MKYIQLALNSSEEKLGEKELLLAIVYYSEKMHKSAIAAFQRASGYKKKQKELLFSG